MRLLLVGLIVLLHGCATQGAYHEVRAGQTLFRIGQIYGVDQGEIMRINGISDPSQLQVGSMLFIPGASGPLAVSGPTEEGVSPRAPVKPAVPARTPVAPKATKPTTPVIASRPTSPPGSTTISAPPSVSKPVSAHKGLLDWPVKGTLVQGFRGSKGGSSGLEIAVSAGTEVRAAAAGRVIYSDNGISGFGHLVILEHDNDLFTIYGFNRENLVKAGSYVKRGQKIALSGVSSRGGKPRLHFEVRRGKTPVDPIMYLP